MTWNWQRPDWPDFTWNAPRLMAAESEFLLGGGMVLGMIKNLSDHETNSLTVESMSLEALTTSEIEGEILDRASVQSSLRRQLGLSTDNRRVGPKEQGIAEVMVDLYRTYDAPLSEDMLFKWHKLIMSGVWLPSNVGSYRTSSDSMQIVSGPIGLERVHFEAPPSKEVPAEMSRFLAWFNRSASGGTHPLPALTRAGAAHLYFESVHPFDDGNGRIGRVIAEKALAQSLGNPSLTVLAATLLARRRSYYAALEAASSYNEITEWLVWFAGAAIEAQRRVRGLVQFLIEKTKLFDRLHGQLNQRQEKALLRMFQAGPQGFEGGLTARKYTSITGASPATTTRDLVDLVDKEALVRTGELKGAHYHLTVPLSPITRITLGSDGAIIEEM